MVFPVNGGVAPYSASGIISQAITAHCVVAEFQRLAYLRAAGQIACSHGERPRSRLLGNYRPSGPIVAISASGGKSPEDGDYARNARHGQGASRRTAAAGILEQLDPVGGAP